MKREMISLKQFMEAPEENRVEFIAFFEKHSQYWKREVFLDLLDFYYVAADLLSELVCKEQEQQ